MTSLTNMETSWNPHDNSYGMEQGFRRLEKRVEEARRDIAGRISTVKIIILMYVVLIILINIINAILSHNA